MSTEDEDDDDIEVVQGDGKGRTGAADLASAYLALNKDLGKSFSADMWKPILDKFRVDVGLDDSFARRFSSQIEIPDLPVSQAPGIQSVIEDMPDLGDMRPITADIAETADRMAHLMQLQHEAIAQLVAMTGANLEHTAAQRESSERTERFARHMSWWSLVVAVASLAAAVGALVVSFFNG